ncbi:uncharacterized protein LOC114536595 [Dendronephthya gigantea]|uniref:uncharacterized protein LOC114536595 n=1 Tax=Dendronephthya gigantea TaxID=151771 RepID=UPI00106C3D23|nr:uncharacterized protein LOC114536595 [Dendronephthya gigantea]XP_028413752.1 uncharacterized protein LOC114536595 [Dendronephthya gigantea]XP_028413753.1 uncharacterized protein LOC114536595 [Dendronephthya gigantea]
MAKKLTTITVHYVEVNFYFPNNGSVTITCTSSGPRLQDYTIYHNGTKVARNMSYTISTVNGTHPGLYNCTAINGLLGELSTVKFLDANMGKPTPSIAPSTTTTRTVPSSSTTSPGGGTSGSVSDNNTGLIVGLSLGGLAFIVIVCFLVYYCCTGTWLCCCAAWSCFCAALSCCCGDDERGNADVNPNGSRVIRNHYELEEDHGEDAGAYDTVKQSDDGEGSQDKKKPAGDSLPPVYASVNKENRQGNTLYASLDSEALRKPGSKKKQPETKNAPTEYASIDFMQTGKTPNADNA